MPEQIPSKVFKELIAAQLFKFVRDEMTLLADLPAMPREVTDGWEVNMITPTHLQIRYKSGENRLPRYFNIKVSEAV